MSFRLVRAPPRVSRGNYHLSALKNRNHFESITHNKFFYLTYAEASRGGIYRGEENMDRALKKLVVS